MTQKSETYHSISPGGYSLDFIYTKKTELVSKTHLDRPPRPQIDRGYFINMFPTIFRPHEFNIPDTRSETPPDSPKFVPKSGPVSLRSSLSARKIMGFDLFNLTSPGLHTWSHCDQILMLPLCTVVLKCFRLLGTHKSLGRDRGANFLTVSGDRSSLNQSLDNQSRMFSDFGRLPSLHHTNSLHGPARVTYASPAV